MNKKALISYLKNVYELEKSLFFLQETHNKMESEIKYLSSIQDQKTESYYKYTPIIDFYIDYGETGEFFDSLSGHFGYIIICIVICIILTIFKIFNSFGQSILIGAIIGFSGPILSMIIRTIINRISVNRKNKEIEQCNIEIVQENDINRQTRNNAIVSLKKEQERNEELYESVNDTLEELYDLDIIYPKYRNFPAISMIFEYMLSERCSSLKGHGGAYDTFEYEQRLNYIIVKLNDIIERLDEIQSNQEQLYFAVNEGLQKSNNIINDMTISINNIENNSLATKYYSEVTAQNTECLKWLEIFDNN